MWRRWESNPRPLDTLAQKTPHSQTKKSVLLKGNGSDLSDTKALQGRAKRKLISQSLALSLIDIAKENEDNESLKSFWNFYHCQNKLHTHNNRIHGNYCKSHICPICCANRKADLINRYLPVVLSWPDQQFLTLTSRSVKKKYRSLQVQNIVMGKLKARQGLLKASILMFALGFLHQTSQASRHNGLFNLKHNFHLLRRYCHSKCGNRWRDYGDGSDGALTVSSGTAYTDALRTGVTGTNAAGGNTLTVASSSGFAVGDEIIIITMVDAATSGNTVGQHEFNIITAISGNTFTLATLRTNAFNASSTQIHQAIKVPNYTNVSISAGAILTCNTWNGSTGGVLCFRANGTLTNAGTITSSGKGYRGVGHNAVWRNKNGAQGEGIYGTGYAGGSSNGSNSVTWNGANGNGGGGGTGRQDSGGGGGGSYASNGTNGNNSGGHYGGTGGLSVGTANLELLIMGGAGGEGGGDEDGQKPGYGGDGGGIIYISASVTQNAGTITCNGQNGGNGTGGGCGHGWWRWWRRWIHKIN